MANTRRFDVVALILAVVVEALLFVAAMFGGPHGALGAWPWMMQFPGILVVFWGNGEAQFLWRVAAGTAIQLLLWYLLIAYLLRLLRERRAKPAQS